MALEHTTTHPSRRSFVVKLHRDARPARGGLQGRAENLATGRHFDFDGGDELLAGLERELAAADPDNGSELGVSPRA
jgi:hypothetical protein